MAHPFGTLSPDDRQFVSNVIYTGQHAGAHPEDIAGACVVLLAIQSGDVVLPWSADQVEIALGAGIMSMPSFLQVRSLMVTAPHFLFGAQIWFATKIFGLE